jgi:hypothetical protein
MGFGLGVLNWRDSAEAKQKHKKHKKRKQHKTAPEAPPQPVFNQFGCVDIGQPCLGDSSLCCSGICQGTAPARGQADTSVCVAHNAGPCVPAADSCMAPAAVQCNASNRFSVCTLTTGNAGFCGDISAGTTTYCRVCSKDTDCQAEFGAGAACVVLGAACTPLCGVTGRTACLPAAI